MTVTIISALKATGLFYCDQVTFKSGTNREWVKRQLEDLGDARNENINETSIGNLLFIYNYADEYDQKKVETFLSNYVLYYYNSKLEDTSVE
jgi:hypothetical protein